MKTMIKLAKDKSELSIVSDQLGTPTYARNLANTLLQIIASDNKKFGIYHYSNEGEISWYDFAKEIFKQSKTDIEIKGISASQFPTLAKRPKYSVLSNKKISETLGIETLNWKDSLKIAISKL